MMIIEGKLFFFESKTNKIESKSPFFEGKTNKIDSKSQNLADTLII